MKWISGFILVCLFMLFLPAFADPVFEGPEGDLYLINGDSGGDGDSTLATSEYPIVLHSNQPVSSQMTDTIQISQLDCSMFPRICMYVDVLDSIGNPIANLTADSFCVLQDDIPIDSFSVEELTLDSCITSIALVIDVSGSMNDNNKIGAARNAAHVFVDSMDIYDRVAIITFANCYTVVQDFTNNKDTLHAKINMISAQGWTAAFDGIWKGIDLTKTELGSKAVIAISDGMENHSQRCGDSTTPDGLWIGAPPQWWWPGNPDPDGWTDDSTLICDLANGAGIPVYTIALGSSFDPQYLINIAAATGGSYYHAPTGDDIAFVYDEIKYRMCSRYLICYDSPDTTQNGDWHLVSACRLDSLQACSPCDIDSCQETDSPEITRTPTVIALEDTCQRWDTSVEICAWAVDLDTPQEDLEVKLFYRNADTLGYASVIMTHTDSLYCYTIPAGVIVCSTDSIQYYITASDGQATVASPPLAPTYHHSFAVCENQPPVISAGNDTTVSQCSPSPICWDVSASDPDGNLETVVKTVGPGTLNGTQMCFTPTQSLDYEFVFKAIDSCGAEAFDTVVVHYSLNAPPVANAGRDSTLFLCQAQQICWTAGCSDPNGNLSSCSLLSGVGSFNGSQICFTPDTAGVYRFVVSAEDDCGQTDLDTSFITVTLNTAPTCSVPDDTTFFQCVPTQVSMPVSGSDVDGNLAGCQVVSGPGSLVGGNWTFTPSSDQIVTVTVRCEDSCGAYCEDQFTVEFDINAAPTISLGNDQSEFLCSSEQVCISYQAGDPDGPEGTTVSLLSAIGTLNTVDSTICFTPDTAGTYILIAQIEDDCAQTDTDTVLVTITFNSAPVADAGADQTLFQCAAAPISWAASCSDVNGNLTNCQLISGVGSYNGTNITFTPTGSGTYDFILQATDACGLTHVDTSSVTVTINTAPSITAQDDSTQFLCSAQEICLSYQVSDPDGLNGLTESMISGFGTIDTANNLMCFTPASAGSYEFIVGVSDSCGAIDRDTVMVTVSFGETASIDCPSGSFNEFLCGPDSIVQALTVSPDSATVWVSEGVYDNGAVRFYAGTEDTYTITVIASVQCGADTCELTFDVDFNSPPTADAGADQNLFQCTASAISWAASCSDVDGNLTDCELISGTGSYNGTNISFTPSGSGTYDFILRATDACGAMGYDTSSITVTLNSAPSVVAQADTSLFLCTPQPVCVSYTPSDPDGLAGLVETMVSGFGSIDTTNNQLCFTPSSAGSYEFIVGVTDACGVNARDTVTVTVSFGETASIDCPSGTFNEFLCGPDSIVQALTVSPDSATVWVSEGIYDNGAVRFYAGTEDTYTITVIASVQCGADTCELTFDVDFNSPPVADAGSDQSVFQCTASAISWAASCSDVDGNLTDCELISGTGSYNGTNISFTPTVSGTYDFILRATDACGAMGYDTSSITVTLNSAPTVVAQADTSLFLCTSQPICVSYTPSDPDGLAGLVETMVSGFGSIDTTNNQLCFTPSSAGSYEFIVGVTDACGVNSRDTVMVTVSFGETASIDCPSGTFNEFLCGPDSIVQALTVSPDSATVWVSEGIYDNGTVRFYAGTEDTYTITVIASVQCGADTCELTFDVDFNSPPIADAGSDQSVFQCTAAPISWAASCSDVDNNLTDCELISGTGSYNGTNISFTPTVSGTYGFILRATDACGAVGYDTSSITVTLNSAPTVVAQADTSLFLCTSQPVCVSYAPSDPDGLAGLVETMVSGFGSIDTTNNQICFTPSSAGAYEFIVGVTDACGVNSRDTVVVTISFGEMATIDCPDDTIFVSLCDTLQVCNMLDIAPDSATVSVSHGTYANDEHCFLPDSSGVYVIDVIASVQCGADTCQLVYKVDIGQAAEISCPDPQDIFICEPGQICIPISVVTPGATFDITPIGSYNAGNICFQADTSGYYVISVVATTSCGSDSCEIIADVTINSNPVAVDPSSPVDTFLCASDQVCYQFNATDTDGGTLVWSKLSGDGALDAGGEWCFNADSDGSWSIMAVVSDSCDAADTISLAYNITLNSKPVVTLDDDVSVFLCAGNSYCFNYVTSDIDNNITAETLLSGVGVLDTVSNEVCFTPSAGGVYQFVIQAVDACGATGLDTINVTVDLGNAVTVTCPGDTAVFFCGPSQVCRPVDIPVDTNVVVSPIGTYNDATGLVCFDADTAGHYVITVQANSDCGSADCQFVVDVTMNSNPVAVDPAPVDTFRCGSGQVCHQFDASDVDGGVLTWSKISGDGAIDSDGNWCLDVSTDGVYSVTVAVADPCGASDTTSLTYTVTINSAPVVTLGADHSIFLCDGDPYCFTYTVTDGDDNVTLESLVSGVGTIDTTLNEVCFTPSASGGYQFVVQADDVCGSSGLDTINITVELGYPVTVTCPGDTAVFFCGPSQVCRPVDIPVDTNVVVSPIGTYNDATGLVCFDADTAGHYVITVQANSDCGSADCQFVVDVTMNSNPVGNDIAPIDTFLCSSQQLCYQFTASDIDGGALTWNRLSGDGTIDASGLWCVTASATGTYSVQAVVSDSCGAADTVGAVVFATFNTAPVISLGNDTTIFQCEQEQLCFTYAVSDVDDNTILEELVDGSGLAVIDTLANTICFTPEPKSPYQFIVQVTDFCGLTDVDTINVMADVNHAPIADAGDDFSLFLCAPEQRCFDVAWSDEDDNVASAYLISAFGELTGSQVCFTPDTSGIYQFIIGAEDACNVTDEDTALVTITMNTAPVCVLPPDTTFFLCTSSEVSLPISATDVDDNYDHCEIVSGPGSIAGGQWTHTPTASGEVTVVVDCLDECEASCVDSFTVTFEFNHPPVAFAGNDSTLFMCEAGESISWPVSCSDPDDNLVSCDLISAFGDYNESEDRIDFTIPQYEKTYEFVMEAIDACDDTVYDTSLITVDFNEPPVVNLPADFVAFFEDPTSICFHADIYDPDDNLASVVVSPIGDYHPESDEICLFASATGMYCLEVTATDACGEVTIDSICIELEIDECFRVQIEKVHNAYQGHQSAVHINYFGSVKEVGGYDLLISYDQSVLALMSLRPGQLIEDCDWEYFTYRFGVTGNCTSCPSGILRIIAIAETNDGAYHPDCYLAGEIGPIAVADFLVSNNYTYGCQYAPIEFFWVDCGDNTFSSREGDTLWTSRLVYNFEYNDITDNQYGFPGFYGAHDSCMVGGGPDKPKPIRCVDFINGGIDIVCPDSIDDRGDVNLNGISYEIADAVTFTEYFIYGLSAFTVNVEGQRAASDINADGITLTVADLAYLIRVIIGDALPLAKPLPSEGFSAGLDLRAGEIAVNRTDAPISVMRYTFEGEVHPSLAEGLEHLQMKYHYDGIATRVIVCNMEDKRYIHEGAVLVVDGDYDLKEAEFASADGQMMRVDINQLPTAFSLRQNYPNPFNPTTIIQFALPQATDWTLTVYNVLGREVEQWKGHDAGTVTIDWNASGFASGVYFYRLKTSEYSNSKTMILLK